MSKLCLLAVLMGGGMAVIRQHILGLIQLSKSSGLWLTIPGWDVALWQSSLVSFRAKSIDPLPHYS